MKGHRKVPLKDVEEIKDFIQKHTQTEISEAWNISYGYVSLLCKNYGIKAKREKCRTPIVDIEQLKEYGKNHTITECSRHFNISPNTISSYKKRFKFETKRHCGDTSYNNTCKIKHTGEAQDMIRTLCETYTDAAIGRVFGYSRERIRQIRNEAGLE